MIKTIRYICFLLIIINGTSCKNRNYVVASAIKLNYQQLAKDKLRESFLIPINNSDDCVYYTRQGSVYLSIHKQQLFDVTQLHTIHRIYNVRKLILEGLSKK